MNQLPSTVYKYFNWNDIESRKILTEQEIYFCDAKQWENYGEYFFNIKPIKKTKIVEILENIVYKKKETDFKQFKEWFEKSINKYKIDIGNPNSLNEIELDLWLCKITDEIINEIASEIVNKPKENEGFLKKLYFDKTGIFSTSLTKTSKPLWSWKSHHKRKLNNNAVCIGLDLEKIILKMNHIGNFSLGLVNYYDEINEIEFLGYNNEFIINQINDVTFSIKKDKVPNIEQQEELRIMKLLIEKDNNTNERVLRIEKSFITEILISSKADKNTKENIEKLAKEIGCNELNYYSFDVM